MGMYTEIFINCDLVKDLPDDVLETLERLTEGEGWKGGRPLFHDMSFYTPNTRVANLTYDKIGENYSLLGKGDLKNCDREIEEFFEWIMPYIDAYDGQFIGYHRYEERELPTLVLKTGRGE